MGRRTFLARLKWIEGRPDGVCIPEGTGPVLYQDADGAVYALNELEMIPQTMARWTRLYDHNLARSRRKTNGNGKPTLSPTERNQMMEAFRSAFIEANPPVAHLPRQQAYRFTTGDGVQFSNLVNARGPDWLRANWSDAIDRYFDALSGSFRIRTLAGLCKSIDVILGWEPRTNGHQSTIYVARKGDKR